MNTNDATLDNPQLEQHLDALLSPNHIENLIADAFAAGATVAWIVHDLIHINISTPDNGTITSRNDPTGVVLLFPFHVTHDEPIEVIVPESNIDSQNKS